MPKNQKRLADSVGGVVGGALLTPEDITSELHQLESAFEERLRELAIELTEGEQPALADLLPESALVEVRGLLTRILGQGREFLAGTLDSPDFREEAGDLLESIRESPTLRLPGRWSRNGSRPSARRSTAGSHGSSTRPPSRRPFAATWMRPRGNCSDPTGRSNN